MDASKALLDHIASEIKKTMDFSIMLYILPSKDRVINGKKFQLVKVKEHYEEVNGHGNETGVFKIRIVEKVRWNWKTWNFGELMHYLEPNKVRST